MEVELDCYWYVTVIGIPNMVNGNWRQVYYDSNGICSVCGSTEHLEFHAPEGEENPKRVLVCFKCLKEQDGEYPLGIDHSNELSQLTEDIQKDMERLGGLVRWKATYNIKDGE